MNTDRIAEISKKIASSYINDCNSIKSFEMTEDEWKKYSKLHPGAKKENHNIIPKKTRTIVKHNMFAPPVTFSLHKMEISKAINHIQQNSSYDFLFDTSAPRNILEQKAKFIEINKKITEFNNHNDISNLNKLVDDLEQTRGYINRYLEAHQNIILDKLSIDNHMQVGAVETLYFDPHTQQSSPNDINILIDVNPVVQEINERFCKMFSSKYIFNPKGKVQFYVSDTVDRSYYNEQYGVGLKANRIDVNFILNQETKTRWRFDVNSMIHELSHNMEISNNHIAKRCNEFLNYRTKGEKALSLNYLWLNNPNTTYEDKLKYPNGPYKPDEVAKPDDFLDPYCGKIYADGVTEIFSWGVAMLIDNPKFFKERDPEYFYFIISLMRGEI